ncbi:MAG: hypothetical protein CMJ89_12805 [Planctomycetes bacterium]|jgi:RND family efflux transporter MFP subunit|nr:hypothetical protein [Planctomycetota bacterium]
MSLANILLLPLAFSLGQEEPVVVTDRVQRADLVRQVRVPASVLPFEEAMLIAHVTGYAARVNVREGDWVNPEEVLVEIDVPLLEEDLDRLEAQVISAEAVLREATSMVVAQRSTVGIQQAALKRSVGEQDLRAVYLQRVERLHERSAATDEELDDARGSHVVAKARVGEVNAALLAAEASTEAAKAHSDSVHANLAVVKADLAKMKATKALASIRSPFERALVVDRRIDRGAFIESMQTTLLHVMNVESVRVRLSVDERDAVFVRPGDLIRLVPDAKSIAPIDAKVTRIAGALDLATRRMDIEVDLPNTDHRLMAGMFINADLDVFRRERVLIVPARALRSDAGQPYLFVVEKGRLVKSLVELGVDDGLRIEILSGLQEGSLVVLSGAESLVEGTRVRTRSGADG